MAKPLATDKQEGEGGNVLAFCIAGAFAGVVLLPVTQLLDLKAAAGWISSAMFFASGAWGIARRRSWNPGRVLVPTLEAWRWATIAVAGYALAQRIGIEPMAVYAQAGSRSRAMGSFGNAGYLAAFLVFSWPMLLDWTGARRALALLLVIGALLATRSRAGTLALVLQAAVLMWMRWRVGWRPGGRIWATGVAFLLLALLVFPVSDWSRPTLRWPLWRATAELCQQHLWLGWGPDKFASTFQELGDSTLVRAINETGQYAEAPHQLLLTVLFASGIVGLVLFIGAMAVLLGVAWTSTSQGIFLALLGVLAESEFDRFFFEPGVQVPLALIAVVLLFRRDIAPLKSRRWPVAIGLAVFSIVSINIAVQPLLAYSRAVGSDLGAGSAALAPAASVEQLQADAKGSRDPLAFDRLGDALAARQQWAPAADAFRQAQGLGPSAGRAQNLGNCAMMLGDAVGAETAYRKAAELDPRSADAQFSLGYALYYQKRLKEAVSALDAALKLDPGNASALKLKEQILQ